MKVVEKVLDTAFDKPSLQVGKGLIEQRGKRLMQRVNWMEGQR